LTEKNNYIAVTIGPVLDTINLASSPSALWAASYMMSMLSKNICSVLLAKGIPQEDIVSPYFDTNDPLINRADGVGLFHDRVIFKADNFDINNFKDIRKEAIQKTVASFGFEKKYISYFENYFLVSAVLIEDSTNPILDSGKILDCLELSKRFVSTSESNPILSFYNSEEEESESRNETIKEEESESRNEEIKKRVTKKMEIKDWQLLKNKKIRSISDIAKGCGDSKIWKKYKYYAVVRSDGDNISKIIAKLSSPAEVRDFSHICIQYCSAIANKLHKDYGGITIYAGGDDLLALMPVEYNKKNIFEFTKEANEDFKKSFSKFNQDISLSFGIFVSYHKFPLYEALEQSAYLLFGVAKKVKNCVAICFQKHSGQSEGLLIYNNALEDYIKFHNECLNMKKDNEKSEDKAKQSVEDKIQEENKIILSAMHKFALYKKLFENAKNETEIRNVFTNTFDADFQKYNNFLHNTLSDFYIKISQNLPIYTLSESGYESKNNSNYALKLEYILRIIKFFKEKAGDNE